MQGKLYRILFVEDDLDTRELVSMVLELQGYQVVCAATYSQALELAQATAFDLYLLDNWLPDGNGIELCRQIRSFDSHKPVIFFSAVAYDTDIKRALEAGADDYITKPFDPYSLEQRVRCFISTGLQFDKKD